MFLKALVLQWAARKPHLHVVTDEIYAKSTFRGEFTSLADPRVDVAGTKGQTMMEQGRLHLLWGFAKDFGLAGFRAGCVYSELELLHTGLTQIGFDRCISNDTQVLLTALLNDQTFVDEYLREYRRRLLTHCEAVERLLDGACIELLRQSSNSRELRYVTPMAGIFVFVDLSDFIPEGSRDNDGEAALFRRLSSEAQVLLTPGSRCACPQSGWFRLCFAGHPVNVIEVAIQRLMCTLAAWPARRASPGCTAYSATTLPPPALR